MLLVRVIVVTILATLLTFAVALFLGITGIVLVDMLRGGGVNLANAYRHIALPVAIVALVVAFAITLTTEIKRYRRARGAVNTDYSRAA